MTFIKHFLMNFATGEMPKNATIETAKPDLPSTILTLSSNADKFVRTLSDCALLEGLEQQEKWEDLTDDSVNSVLAEAISALITHAIRRERDRRIGMPIPS